MSQQYYQQPPPQQGYYQQGPPPQQGYYQQQPVYVQQAPPQKESGCLDQCLKLLCCCFLLELVCDN
ncbi:hypothetical protein RNJ44_02702 [Nakaseomyces bracarensis]|uniref:Cysteine-rich transmembrane CYSTM domain-containing protein n=1 Tax=Nakaseomyces bracarensis TaxID=273131 RepID=A0ABR4P001_9SACH